MKKITSSQIKKSALIKKLILLFFFFSACMVVFLDITWSYRIFASGMGTRLAQAVIAYHVVLLLGMVAVGIGLGYWVDRMIRQKKSIFSSPNKGSWTEVFMKLWGHESIGEENTLLEIDSVPEPNPDAPEPFELLDLPARRGRKPTFPLERWLPIAVQWENRDPIRDAFTLGELICEHLGTNSDGSPIVSEQTYYSTWRPRAIAEIRSRTKSKISNTHRAAEKDSK